MKRFYFLATLILGLLLSSCDNKEDQGICDPPIVTFEIIITDADGNLIIQSENGEEKIRELLSIEHCGRTVTLLKEGESRPHEQPFYVGYDLNGNRTRIFYGFFFVSHNYKDETFILKWKDGSQDIVKFSTFWKFNKYNIEAFYNGTKITECSEDRFMPVIRKTIK